MRLKVTTTFDLGIFLRRNTHILLRRMKTKRTRIPVLCYACLLYA